MQDVSTPQPATVADDESGYRLADQIGFKLRIANQKHLEIFAREMPEVTPTQFAVLARLSEVGEQSQNRLGRGVGMDAATTKGVVERLRAKGLVELRPSPTDQRRVMISLSPDGARFARHAIGIARRISRLTAAKLTPRELERLSSLLDKL